MSRVGALRRDPALPMLLVSIGGLVSGLLLVALGWAGASRQLFLALQVPWLVSGGFGGLALLGMSAALLAVQLRRRTVALAVVELDRATALAASIATALEQRRDQ